MKITKKKEIVTEEISVVIKDYYFDVDLVSHKVTFKDDKNYTMETLHNFANIKAIKQNTYDQYDDNTLPIRAIPIRRKRKRGNQGRV